jgi:hypothetical protein
MHPLYGPRLKLRRANKHLNAIKEAIDSFIAGKPYSFVLEPNPQPPAYAIIAKVSQLAPDDELGLIIGDFAHNTRSALDLLIQQLSQLPIEDKRRFYLEFPIFDCVKDYTSHVKRYLAGVVPEQVTIIEGFQPYKRADRYNDDALGILQVINNADKHRIIHVVGTIVKFKGLGFGEGKIGSNVMIGRGAQITVGHRAEVDFGGFRYKGVGDGVIAKDRTIVAELTSSVPIQMNMYPNFEVSIQFGEGNPRVKGRPVMDTCTFIYDRVKEVVGEFEKIFPK